MIPQSKWVWFGNAAHFIGGRSCRFHMATQVGDYLVSTVGQLWFDEPVRKIHAQFHDPVWFRENATKRGDDWDHAYMERFGYENIGYKRKYETMVFKAGASCTAEGCGCGLPSVAGTELDFDGYNDAKAATEGHRAMCLKAARGALRLNPP